MSMTQTEHNSAARRRGELTRDRGSRRLSAAIDARRRLNTRPADRHPDQRTPARSERPPPRVPDAIVRLARPVVPHVECVACKTRLHNTESQSRSDRGLCPVCGSLLEPVGNLSEIVRVPRSRVMRRLVAPRRIRGRAADRRRGRRDHRLTRAQARTSPARNRKLRRSLSHPTSPSLGSRAPGSGDDAVRHRRHAPTPAGRDCRPSAELRRGASSARTAAPDEGSHFALAAGLAATWAGLSHAG